MRFDLNPLILYFLQVLVMDSMRDAIRDAIRFESFNFVFFSQDPIGSLRDSIRDAMRDAMRNAMRDAMRDAIRFFASLIASLKLRDAKFFSDRIPRANFRDATEGCDPIASLVMHSLRYKQTNGQTGLKS